MDPLTIAGLAVAGVQGIGSLISGIFGNKSVKQTNQTNLQIAREQNAFNERMLNKQNDFNVEQWNRNNEYNTPLAQRQRFEEAGINPYFALGNMQAGNAQALQSADAKPAATPAAQIPADYSYIGQSLSNSMSTFLNLASLKEDIEAKKLNNERMRYDNAFAAQSFQNRLDALSIGNNRSQQELNNMKLDYKYADETYASRVSQMTEAAKQALIRTNQETIRNNIMSKEYEDIAYKVKHLNPLQKEKMAEEIKKIMADQYATMLQANDNHALTLAQCNKLVEDSLLIAAQRVGVNINNVIRKGTMKNEIQESAVRLKREQQALQNDKKMGRAMDDKHGYERYEKYAYPLKTASQLWKDYTQGVRNMAAAGGEFIPF